MRPILNKLKKIILPLILCLVITGAGFLEISFSGTDSSNPLVDLGVLIKNGGSHMSVEAPGERAENESNDSDHNGDNDTSATEQGGVPAVDVTGEGVEAAPVVENEKDSDRDTAYVEIFGTDITFNGMEQTEARFLTLLDSADKTGMSVEIDNTYADYRLFKRIMDHITDSGMHIISIKD